jgi:hypothetical protein
VRQVIEAPVGRHSEKPAEAHKRIERLTDGPYLELFAREARDGWTCWGNEIPRDRFVIPVASLIESCNPSTGEITPTNATVRTVDADNIVVASSDDITENEAAKPTTASPEPAIAESLTPAVAGSIHCEIGEITPAGVVVHTVDTTKAAAASSCDDARNGAEIPDSASSEPAIAASPTLPAAVAGSTISDIDLDIPDFLRRNPDNSVPSVPVASPREAQSGISGEAGG